MFDIQAVMPNLLSLQFKSSFSAPLNITPPQTPFSAIRLLKLELSNLLLPYVKHLATGLPDTLETLKINVTDIYFGQWIQEIEKSHILQFAARACRLDRFKVKLDARDYDGETIWQSEEEMETIITIFYSFLNSLIGN